MLMCPFVTFTVVGLLTTLVLSNPLFFIRYSLPNVFSLSLVPSVPNLNHFALSPSLAYNGFLLLIVATPESLICNHVRPCPSPSPPSSPSAWCTSEPCCLAWFFLVPRLQEMHHVPRFHLYLLCHTPCIWVFPSHQVWPNFLPSCLSAFQLCALISALRYTMHYSWFAKKRMINIYHKLSRSHNALADFLKWSYVWNMCLYVSSLFAIISDCSSNKCWVLVTQWVLF